MAFLTREQQTNISLLLARPESQVGVPENLGRGPEIFGGEVPRLFGAVGGNLGGFGEKFGHLGHPKMKEKEAEIISSGRES